MKKKKQKCKNHQQMHILYRFDFIDLLEIYSDCEISPSRYKCEGEYIQSTAVQGFFFFQSINYQTIKTIETLF